MTGSIFVLKQSICPLITKWKYSFRIYFFMVRTTNEYIRPTWSAWVSFCSFFSIFISLSHTIALFRPNPLGKQSIQLHLLKGLLFGLTFWFEGIQKLYVVHTWEKTGLVSKLGECERFYTLKQEPWFINRHPNSLGSPENFLSPSVR